jgi:ATP-dependent Clp protease ATP-binding subunit ClpC
MFERYTEKARRAIFYARFEASESGKLQIEPAHVLLGLLRENKELLSRLLQVPDPAPLLRQKISQLLPTAEKISTSVE